MLSLRKPSWDVFLVALLVFALIQITSLAESAVLPTRYQDVVRHPWLGQLLPTAGVVAMGEIGPRPGEPVGLLLIVLTLAALILYALADLLPWSAWRVRLKWLFLITIILSAVFLPSAKMILLRNQSGPASYSHDGGVIQTEATLKFLFEGKNPYREDYTQTAMAEWGFSQYQTALYHYPYLPWTFLLSAPFYWVGQQLGGYDQRLVYLLLMALALVLAPRLVGKMSNSRVQVEPSAIKMALVACLALNPIMALDLIFGQNDSFVLCWIIFALVCWQQGETQRQTEDAGNRWHNTALLCYGLACASKPTAWFFAPFLGLLMMGSSSNKDALTPGAMVRLLVNMAWRARFAILAFLLLVLPYALWDAWAFYDDVWRWSNGQGETGYQIWGWGASNLVLLAGWVPSRFAQWPFLWLEVGLALPVLIWFLYRQWQQNTLSSACWHYGLFLLVFFYTSRFLNENYLGYILAFLILGYFTDQAPLPAASESSSGASVSGSIRN